MLFKIRNVEMVVIKKVNNTKKVQSEGYLTYDQVEREYPGSEEVKANINDDEDPDDHDFAVTGDYYTVEG